MRLTIGVYSGAIITVTGLIGNQVSATVELPCPLSGKLSRLQSTEDENRQCDNCQDADDSPDQSTSTHVILLSFCASLTANFSVCGSEIARLKTGILSGIRVMVL